MLSISSILDRLRCDFPYITFRESNEFRWSPQDEAIFYNAEESPSLLLHELGHALLKHKEFRRDIELIALERDAWQVAVRDLSPRYALPIKKDEIEDALDTYRDWLHARSSCPHCRSTGVQTAKMAYSCLTCPATWRVNDARICSLRRFLLTKNAPLT